MGKSSSLLEGFSLCWGVGRKGCTTKMNHIFPILSVTGEQEEPLLTGPKKQFLKAFQTDVLLYLAGKGQVSPLQIAPLSMSFSVAFAGISSVFFLTL